MKSLMVVLMVMCLGGCAATPVKAPAGCENSFVWQCGFMPQGKDLVELGFAALLTAKPEFRPQIKAGALKAWQAVQKGTLKGAVGELLKVLENNPQYAPLALFALERLNLEKALDKCDQEVLLDMFHAIAVYAGAQDKDFNPGLAEVASSQR